MWKIEAALAEKWNNIAKLLDKTSRGYQYRKYYIKESNWLVYLSWAIKERNVLWKKFITVKGKNLCESMKEYNSQFPKIGILNNETVVKKKKKKKKKSKVKVDYKKYLRSSERKSKRLDYIAKMLNTCECCKIQYASKNLCLHHHCYWRVWKEKPIDLAVVCHSCHEKIHFEDWVKMPLTKKILKARYDNITKKTYL